MISPNNTLRALAERYAMEHDIRPSSADQHRYTVANLERHLGRIATLDDLCDDTVNRWLVWLGQQGLATESIRSRRRCLLTLWRAAYADELAAALPGRIRRVKPSHAVPVCWSQDELQRLLAVAATKTKAMQRHRAVRWCDFWLALIHLAYASGLRMADVLNLRCDQIAADGTLFVFQRKTGSAIQCKLPAEAMLAIRAIGKPTRARLIGDLLCRQSLQKELRFLTRQAGVAGSMKWFRRTGATWCESNAPGSAMAFLGHRTPGLAYKHYVDPRYIQRERPMPPPLRA